jgi:hypothetical protein
MLMLRKYRFENSRVGLLKDSLKKAFNKMISKEERLLSKELLFPGLGDCQISYLPPYAE